MARSPSFLDRSSVLNRDCPSLFRTRFFISNHRRLGFNKTGANTKAVVLKLKFGMEPIRQCPHELETQPSIRGRIEILREAYAVVSHFHHK